MNERIKQLAEQSTTKGEWSCVNNRYMEEFDKEKFAELIIRECADTVTDRCEMHGEYDEKRAAYYANRIKEHFGIEK
jgi:hypothetical protein